MNSLTQWLKARLTRADLPLLAAMLAVLLSALTLDKVGDIALLLFSLNFLLVVVSLRWRAGGAFVYNAAFLLSAVGLFELYAHYKPAPKTTNEGAYHTEGFFKLDPDLSYAIQPRDDRQLDSLLKGPDGALLYHVTYGVNRFGYRLSPPTPAPSDDANIVFFLGDSFTFGEGVNDDETLPYAFARLTGARSYNFGVPGYGSHQILRQLETGLLRKVEPRDPRLIVYSLLPTAHMVRAAGRAAWDQFGTPHYESIGGAAKYLGKFAPWSPTSLRFLDAIVTRSVIYKNFVDSPLRHRVGETDRERVAALVKTAQQTAHDVYHANFVVVLWDVNLMGDANATWIAERLKKDGAPTLRLSEALPQLQDGAYYIPVDQHPTAAALALVAAALQRFLETTP